MNRTPKRRTLKINDSAINIFMDRFDALERKSDEQTTSLKTDIEKLHKNFSVKINKLENNYLSLKRCYNNLQTRANIVEAVPNLENNSPVRMKTQDYILNSISDYDMEFVSEKDDPWGTRW